MDEFAQLRKFYQVETDQELIRAQEMHIKRLQERLAAHDILPKDVFRPNRVREG